MFAEYLEVVSLLIRIGHPTAAEKAFREFMKDADPALLHEHERAIRRGIAEFFVPRQRTALTELLALCLPPVVSLPVKPAHPFEEATSVVRQVDVVRTNGGMYSYEEIQKQKGDQGVTYKELLNTVEWHERRTTILARDGSRCQGKSCAAGKSVLLRSCLLVVHHLYYLYGKLPWDHPDDALLTLCTDCHDEFHRAPVPVYREVDGERCLWDWVVRRGNAPNGDTLMSINEVLPEEDPKRKLWLVGRHARFPE